MSKPLHQLEREEWEQFAAAVRDKMRDISELCKTLETAKGQARAQLVRNTMNHINENILK